MHKLHKEIKRRSILSLIEKKKIPRSQLCYYGDINLHDVVEYLEPPVPIKTIRNFLTDVSTR